jgi:hypothetical protein
MNVERKLDFIYTKLNNIEMNNKSALNKNILNPKKNIRCHNCFKTGCISKNCRVEKRKCRNCHIIGHVEKYYRRKEVNRNEYGKKTMQFPPNPTQQTMYPYFYPIPNMQQNFLGRNQMLSFVGPPNMMTTQQQGSY